MSVFEIWDLDSGNLIAEFESEAEALTTVREAITRSGRQYAVDLGLSTYDSEGHPKVIADGEALIERALRAAGSVA